jgi:hypothetical protein
MENVKDLGEGAGAPDAESSTSDQRDCRTCSVSYSGGVWSITSDCDPACKCPATNENKSVSVVLADGRTVKFLDGDQKPKFKRSDGKFTDETSTDATAKVYVYKKDGENKRILACVPRRKNEQ